MKIPMTLITGFLGSGKSTLINRILKSRPDIKFGLIVNEFGDVKLESAIVEAKDGEVVELSNGCMCCVVRTDLVSTVESFLAQAPQVQHLLVEASGLSDPLPIAQTFLMNDLGGRLRFDSIISLVDTLNFSQNVKNFNVAMQQLRYADFLVLTKTDVSASKDVQRLEELLSAVAPRALRFDSRRKDLLDFLLDVDTLDHSELKELQVYEAFSLVKAPDPSGASGSGTKASRLKPTKKVAHKHEPVDTYFYKQERPFDFKKVGEVLDNLPPEVVRAKGFLLLNTPEAKDLKVIFQSVALRNGMDAKPWKEDEPRLSALVFIGKGLKVAELKSRLDQALA